MDGRAGGSGEGSIGRRRLTPCVRGVQALVHDNVVSLIDTVWEDEYICLVMDVSRLRTALSVPLRVLPFSSSSPSSPSLFSVMRDYITQKCPAWVYADCSHRTLGPPYEYRTWNSTATGKIWQSTSRSTPHFPRARWRTLRDRSRGRCRTCTPSGLCTVTSSRKISWCTTRRDPSCQSSASPTLGLRDT